MRVYARTRHGRPRRLIAGSSFFIRNLRILLVGSTLTADQGAIAGGGGIDTRHVYWWDLTTHRSGVLALGSRESWVGTVPGGFLLSNFDTAGTITGYSIEKLNGTVIPWTSPFDHAPVLETGPRGIVNFDAAHFQFIAYGSDTVVPLARPGAGYDPEEISCPGVAARYFTCADSFPDDQGDHTFAYSYLFFPLDGRKIIYINGTRSLHATAVGSRIAYRRHRRIVFRSADGRRHRARSRAIPVGAAFGGLLTTNRSATRIDLVIDAHARPVNLVGGA
jgi:hypothetical protein